MSKIPRNYNGSELVKKLRGFGYDIVHQTGSHIIIRTMKNGSHTLPIPNHKPLKIGTLNAILGQIASHFDIDKKEVVERIFGT